VHCFPSVRLSSPSWNRERKAMESVLHRLLWSPRLTRSPREIAAGQKGYCLHYCLSVCLSDCSSVEFWVDFHANWGMCIQQGSDKSELNFGSDPDIFCTYYVIYS